MARTGPASSYRGPWISVALALSLSSVAYAGPGVWTSGGPYGGDVRALAIDPTTPSTLYAGTSRDGVFKSINSGGTWANASTGLTGLDVEILAIDPKTPATLYAGTFDGVFKSTNSGGTWAGVNTGLTNQSIYALAIDPKTPATLYAGTSGGVFKSTNSGGTWAAANTGLGNFDVSALAINPATPATLYVATFSGGVFKSTNSGGTWAASSMDLHPYINALAIDPTTPSTLYAGASDVGAYKSTDSGGHWVGASTGLMSTYFGTNLLDWGTSVYAFSIDPTTPGTLYAVVSRGYMGGVFKSTDSGSHWNVANLGMTGFPSALAIDPVTPSTLYVAADGVFRSADAAYGVFKSTDSGGYWVAANTGLTNLTATVLAIDPTTPTTLYSVTSGKVFRSTNSGSTWAASYLRDALALAIDPTTPTTLYASTNLNGVLYRSPDSGLTWEDAHSGLPFFVIRALAIDPATSATVYAGSAGGVYKSTNSGATWAAANTGLTNPGVLTFAIDPPTPATIYVGTFDGVFKSTNSGATWAAANTGLTNMAVLALAIDPSASATLYAGTDGGVFKSTDSGGTWAATGLANLTIRALAIDPSTPATLYASTLGDGVFKSTNSGGTWASANAGLRYLAVNALALDPTGVTTLYAATDGGVWQWTPAAVLDSDLTLTLSDSPDPVTGTMPLTYTIAVSSVGSGGSGVASSLTVVHTLPADVAFNGAVGTGWTCGESGGVVTCTRASLAVNTAAPPITVQVTPGPAATVLASSATVTAAGTDPNPGNNSDSETTTVAEAQVWMGARSETVLADSGTFFASGGVTYTITFTNAGIAAQGDNAGPEFVDTLPSSLNLVSASATSGTAATDLPSNSVSWDGSIPSGGSVTITIHATINSTVALGTTIANQGTVYYDADGNGANEASALTDDPGKPGANDPTTLIVVSPVMDFYTLTPCRLVDTRDADGSFGGPALVAGADRVFPLLGRCGIPSTAYALSLNVAVTEPTAIGNLRLYPAGTPLPLASALNYSEQQTRASNAVVPLNGLGELAVRCTQPSGGAHVILDVNGYFQ